MEIRIPYRCEKMKPVISVIVPLYNAERFIEETLDCILSQTFQETEVLVCDDGSTDHGYKKVKEVTDKRLRLLKNDSNRGIAYTRNRLIENADGKYIALWDDDDLSPKDRLKWELERIEKSNTDIVLGHWCEINEAGAQIGPIYYALRNPKYLRARQLISNMPGNGTALIRKDFITKNKIRYRENMFGAEDYRFWSECLVNGAAFSTVEEILLYHRVHGDNASLLAMKEKEKERERVLAEIRRYTLENSGFRFREEDFAILDGIFKETGIVVETMEQLRRLRRIFLDMTGQAYSMKLDNADEIKIMCRRLFGDVVGQARFLWEAKETS